MKTRGCYAEKYAVLSDILGDEDHLGDMDFKVTGTRDGITATQMDINVVGLSYEILERALNQAKEGRMHILDKITETIAEPRADLKDHAPRIETMTIPKEFIGAVIGPGGKIIQGIGRRAAGAFAVAEADLHDRAFEYVVRVGVDGEGDTLPIFYVTYVGFIHVG